MGVVEKIHPVEKLDFAAWFGLLVQALLSLDVNYLIETAWPIFGPMLIGSIPTAIVVWLAFYIVLKPIIHSYQVQRRARRMRKAKEESESQTTPPAGPAATQRKVTT
jgi:hypothetical protein